MSHRRWFHEIVPLSVVLVVLLAPSICQAGVDIFVRVDGILGESTDARHKDWIDAAAMAESFLYPTSVPPSGTIGGSTKAQFSPVRILKYLDKASPKLRESLAKGEHLKEVLIDLCQQTGNRSTVLQLRLLDVIVCEVSLSVTAAGIPQEAIGFSYSRYSVKYNQYKPDGTPGGSIPFGFDLLKWVPVGF